MITAIDPLPMGSRRWRIAPWLGVMASIVVAVIVLLTTARSAGAATLLGFAGVSALLLLGKERVPPLFTFLFSLVGLLNGAGYAWGLFRQPGPFDEIAHLFTTFVVTLTLAYAVHQSVRVQFREHLILFIVMVTSFGASLSVVWEWIEWLFNFGAGLEDTLSDLLLGTIGALLAGLLAAWGLCQEPRPSRPTGPTRGVPSHRSSNARVSGVLRPRAKRRWINFTTSTTKRGRRAQPATTPQSFAPSGTVWRMTRKKGT